MARPVKGKPQKRSYDSAKRREQAKATRAAILDAARRLFVERGFAATTLQALADEAEVAVQTVYATFGSKKEVLRVLIDVSVVGDDEAVPLMERDAVQAIVREPDQRARAKQQAALITTIMGRVADVTMVARAAAGADPDAAVEWRRYMAQRHEGMTHAASALAGDDGLRMPLQEAADIIHALWSPELYTILVRELGWSPERYETWMADILERTLLP